MIVILLSFSSSSLSPLSLLFLPGGIIQHHCTSDPIDHAVQVVGFNLNDGKQKEGERKRMDEGRT